MRWVEKLSPCKITTLCVSAFFSSKAETRGQIGSGSKREASPGLQGIQRKAASGRTEEEGCPVLAEPEESTGRSRSWKNWREWFQYRGEQSKYHFNHSETSMQKAVLEGSLYCWLDYHFMELINNFLGGKYLSIILWWFSSCLGCFQAAEMVRMKYIKLQQVSLWIFLQKANQIRWGWGWGE